MLTKTISIDQITITENGIVIYRECTNILEDGTQLSCAYHKSSLTPGQDLSSTPEKVAQYCRMAWTPEVIAAYKSAQSNGGLK